MGRKNPERWPPSTWRALAPTVERMARLNWEVTVRCRKCGIELLADLRLMQRVLGPGFSPWNQITRCKKVRCGGHADFYGRPPGIAMSFPLVAPRPDGEEER